MAFRPARSLLHPYPEPLPPYTPRQNVFDPETSSIHSSAPSYVSAAPSYHSGPHPSHTRANEPSATSSTPNPSLRAQASSPALPTSSSGLLSSQQHAPGFGNTAAGSSSNNPRRSSNNLTNSHLHSLYNVSEWVPVAGGLQARHYHNVAKRRVSEASQYDSLARSVFPPLFQGLSDSSALGSMGESSAMPSARTSSPGTMGHHLRGSSSSILGSLHEDSVIHPRTRSPLQSTSANNVGAVDASQADLGQLPVSPHEDPDLVGEAAAAMFRSQRLYITYQQQENNSVEAQSISPNTGRPHQQTTAGRTHQYSSLITPAGSATTTTPSSSPDQQSRSTSNPDASAETTTAQSERTTSQQPDIQPTSTAQQNTPATTQLLDDDALCAQESKTWDFMLAQMADWEERERSWKKFKDEMDKKLSSSKLGLGLGWGLWSLSAAAGIGGSRNGRGNGSGSGSGSGSGRGKLKKSGPFGHEKKWKRRVGLAS
ncbi:hypothetical protein AJ79_01530 [Helicocarpus griseus UAMH5409]|uniref:Uncharacterized protein n=1 Tax=Helicocarpus griseus UAMH5409 TaxID=1447875 RepID=A0A2B7Y6Y6_9EURO|nr:hypothetical protein AJ79_01530 [Helicocarpus griseus UAMH5409]